MRGAYEHERFRSYASFKIAVPARPHFVDVPNAPVTLRLGEMFTLKSDAEFDLDVASATSPQGAPLAQPVRIHFVTPPALDAPTLLPEDRSVGIQPYSQPSITFAEPVADQAAATQALQIDPPVAGHWEWNSASRAEFVPDTRLPILSELTIAVLGGPDGPRTVAGGYMEGGVSATFRTTDNKRIEVSLGRQTMTLFESGSPIRTIYVACDGCVSMTDADAKVVYDWADVGTPIVIYS